MDTVTIKEYKKLENRLKNLEQLVKIIYKDELTKQKVKKLEQVSKKLDKGSGKRFRSYRGFAKYVKSL